ncbi:hypothetical protein MSAN_02024200 [Mycena sanguinolenta]|uniref:Uncharacterized protein n=1 Tax=Mycena sanguinolenta TaxID=230812 RepID=A0A8H6XLK1_9AGAR|nr:hypothetical protein MSAN_02024200 [Mycena sanguinolenta]
MSTPETATPNPDLDVAKREAAAAAAADAAEKEADRMALEKQKAAADGEPGAGQAPDERGGWHHPRPPPLPPLRKSSPPLTTPLSPPRRAKDALAIEAEIKAKEEAVKKAEKATAKAEAKAAAAKAKAAADEQAALAKAKAAYDAEVAHLTKLAAQKRDDAIKKAGEALTKVRFVLISFHFLLWSLDGADAGILYLCHCWHFCRVLLAFLWDAASSLLVAPLAPHISYPFLPFPAASFLRVSNPSRSSCLLVFLLHEPNADNAPAQAVTNASIIRRKEEAAAQTARAKADEAAAKVRALTPFVNSIFAHGFFFSSISLSTSVAYFVYSRTTLTHDLDNASPSTYAHILTYTHTLLRLLAPWPCCLSPQIIKSTARLEAEKSAWKERQAAEKEAAAAFAKAAKLATSEREKAEKEAESQRQKAIKAILAKRSKAFDAAESAKLTAEREAEAEEAAANNLEAGEPEGDKLPQGLVDWISGLIWGAKNLAPELQGAK